MPTSTRFHAVHLSTAECWDRLESATVGRIAITVAALPVILPVFFCAVDQSVVFRTAPGTKLHAATAGNVVAFEVDQFVPGHEGWSVVVQGIARELVAPEELARARALPLSAVTTGGRDRFVALSARMISGRLLEAGPV